MKLQSSIQKLPLLEYDEMGTLNKTCANIILFHFGSKVTLSCARLQCTPYLSVHCVNNWSRAVGCRVQALKVGEGLALPVKPKKEQKNQQLHDHVTIYISLA